MQFHCSTRVVVAMSLVAGLSTVTPATTHRDEKSILVTVLDHADVPIAGLVAADFAVFEDGTKREVVSAELATAPMFVSLLIDNAKPASGNASPMRDMRTALIAFVNTILTTSPTTQIALTGVGGAGLLMKNFTNSAVDLEKTLSRLTPDPRASSVMLEAMIDAAKEIAKKPGPRRALVTLDMASKESSQVQPTKVAEAVRKSGAAVWSVSVQGMESVTSPTRDTTLNYLVENTGGVRLTALMPSALEMMLQKVAQSLTAQYVVTYTRPNGATPKGVAVSGRKGSKFLVAPWVQ